MGNVKSLSLVLLVMVGFSFLNCGNSNSTTSATGPIDGSYVTGTWTCGTTNVYSYLTAHSVTGVNFNVANTTGSSVVNYTGGCVRTQPLTAPIPRPLPKVSSTKRRLVKKFDYGSKTWVAERQE